LKIKKIDTNSILPIIIKKIKLIFEDINKLLKSKFCKLNISELTVFVKVSIESLNDFSKPISSITKKLDKIKIFIKNDMKIKNEIFTLSEVILLSELKIVLFITLLGLISFIISDEVIFKRI
tara:strand:+ start:68 stop:433 length:366 start_codon:yes stop_codon:yes gene_type:complete